MLAFNEQQQRVLPYYGTEGDELRTFTWQGGVSDFVAQTGVGLPDAPYHEGITDFRNPHPAHEFYWGLEQIVTALLETGLLLTTMKEYPYSNGYKPFDEMRQEGRRWYLPEGTPPMPMMYGIVARKSGGEP